MMYPWGDKRRYYSYSHYFRKIFGSRIQKLSVNAGFSCPNRDGTIASDGCTFCSNEAFTPSYCLSTKSIAQQLQQGVDFHRNRYRKADHYIAYFQSFSNTHAPLESLKRTFEEALDFPSLVGIIIGTRPDCVDQEKLDYLATLARDHYVVVEYGVESSYDATLQYIRRGHNFETARRAIEATAARGIHTGAHFILGLPSESRQMMLEQVERINDLPLTTVKFHQLQLFKDTVMAAQYAADPDKFQFFALEEYLDFFIEILERLRPDLVIERFASEAPPRFHVGPNWGALRNEQLWQQLERKLAIRETFQGRLCKGFRKK